jgi:hypothetical protein
MALPRGLGEIDRREFFQYLSAATAAFLAGNRAHDGEAVQRLAIVAPSTRLDDTTVGHLEEVTAVCRRSMQEVRLPTHVQIGDALAQMRRLVALDLRAHPQRLGRRLVGLVGENALLAGILFAWGPRDLTAAEAYLDIARTAAIESRHGELEAMVLAYQSICMSYGGRPADALAAAGAGRDLALRRGATSATRAYLARTLAELHATAGDERQCRALMEEARTALLEAPAGAGGSWIGFGSCDETTLAATEGSALLMLGRPGDAAVVLRHAVSHTESSHSHRTWTVSSLAAACIQQGGLDEGCRYAREALALGVHTEDAEPVRVVADLIRGPLKRYEHEAPVRELRDLMREAGERSYPAL